MLMTVCLDKTIPPDVTVSLSVEVICHQTVSKIL